MSGVKWFFPEKLSELYSLNANPDYAVCGGGTMLLDLLFLTFRADHQSGVASVLGPLRAAGTLWLIPFYILYNSYFNSLRALRTTMSVEPS